MLVRDFSFRLVFLSCRLLVSCVAKTQFAGNLQFWCVSFFLSSTTLNISTFAHLILCCCRLHKLCMYLCVIVCSVLTVKMVFKYLQSLSQMLEYLQILVILILSILFFLSIFMRFFYIPLQTSQTSHNANYMKIHNGNEKHRSASAIIFPML